MSLQVNKSTSHDATIMAINLLKNLQSLTLFLTRTGERGYVEDLETSLLVVQYLRKSRVIQWGDMNDIIEIFDTLSILQPHFLRVVIYGLEIGELYAANVNTFWNSLHQLRMTKQIDFSIEINTFPEVEMQICGPAAELTEHNSKCSKWWHLAHDSSSSEESSSNPAPL